MRNENKLAWWGSPRHQLFTIIVFVILASLDNAARGVLPPLYAVMARDLVVAESSLGLVTALTILVVAVTSVWWGYRGDKGNRKRLLFYGTLIWSTAMLFTGLAQSYLQFLMFQVVTAVGIGCIASVGFSVISDLIPPARRGLALSFWGLSQGGGGGIGAMLGGFLGAYNWPLPFFTVAAAGMLFAVLYLFTFEPRRGRTELELASLFAAGKSYQHHIQGADIRLILSRRSNRWLMLQAFLATLTYGSLGWMPRLFIARVEAAGYSLETATMAGNLFSLLFQTGFYFAILGGHLGDRWQQRRPGDRALLCSLGIWASIPFQMLVFLVPLHGLDLPPQGGVVAVAGATLMTIVTNPGVAGAFVLALVAIALASVDIPNRSALLTELNLPEHRGTMAGFLTIATGLGVAMGNALAGLLFGYLENHFAPPLNYAVGLACFQLLFIPAGWCYYQLSKTSGYDISQVKQVLAERGQQPS